MKRTQKGFTLVELLVVIAILAILATVSVVGYTSFIDRANESNAQTEADQIKTIVENGILVDDYVILKKDTATGEDEHNGVYYVKSSKTFVKAAPTTGNAFDATDDIAGLGGTLTVETAGSLTYNNYGYNVNVMTRVATKAD